MFGFLKRLFGTHTDRNIKKLRPYVTKINQQFAELSSLSHDELRAETTELRKQLAIQVQPLEQSIAILQAQATESPRIKEQYAFFEKIDKLKVQLRHKIENTLNQMLPRAFAIVKETARRLKGEKKLIVTSSAFDRSLAEKRDYVTCDKDKAHWSTTWLVGEQSLKWDVVHYDVQLMGGIVLHQGKVAEMGTGEGKTLASTLPAFLNALAKKGVHIITVNDYLARRDMQWMRPLFEFHGISVACIEGTPIQSLERKEAYAADITYGTGSGFGFDYLYDNIATSTATQVQREKHYAIIDEIDSVVIDEARTPLIISGPTQIDDYKIYRSLKPRIKQMHQAQRQLVVEFVKNAKQQIEEKKYREGGLSLFRAHRGLPSYPPLISYLSERGIKKIFARTESLLLEQNNKLMPEADKVLFFTVDKKTNTIDLTDKGINYLTQKDEEADFFVLPDIASEMVAIEKNIELNSTEKKAAKEEVFQIFSIKSSRIHAVNQLLKAYTLYRKNSEYVVLDHAVKIVDKTTGRVLSGRRYSDGLHQALEAKEDLSIAKASQVYATITPSNQFRMYHKLCGMTGTAATESVEMGEIYELEVVVIPPNKPIRRKDLNDRLYKTQREKYNAVAKMVQNTHKTTRPILLITPSVEVSERMRKLLNLPPNQVLNAKNHHLEATIIARAGEINAITIATQMAGRGTDIKVGPEAEAAGGLVVIIVEKAEIRRVDNQARGRTGRQGQPGTSVCFLSLEDELVVHWKHEALGKQVDRVWKKEGEVLIDKTVNKIILSVQKSKEQNRFFSRKRALEYDNVMDKQRKTIYQRRIHALKNNRLEYDVLYALYSTIRDQIEHTLATQKIRSENLKLTSILNLEENEVETLLKKNSPQAVVRTIYRKAKEEKSQRDAVLTKAIYEKLTSAPEAKYALVPLQHNDGKDTNTTSTVEINIAQALETKGASIVKVIQSRITLNIIDTLWILHLQRMSELRESVRMASYEQKDPLLVYKIEAVKLFEQFMQMIQLSITQFLFSYEAKVEEISLRQEGEAPRSLKDLKASQDNPEEMKKIADAPVLLENTIARNERVSVRYVDGTLKENVKYKAVEADLAEGKCTLTIYSS